MPHPNPGPWDLKVLFGIGLMHALALLAPFYWNTSAIVLCVVFILLTGWFGITLCFHRLLTHRSFRTPKWFEYVLTTLGCLAWQGGPIQWVGVHRLHHQHSDQENDPHTPKHGFTWAHITWTLRRYPDGKDPKDAAGDLKKNPVTAFLDRYFYVPQIILAVAFALIGYWVGGTYTAVAWIAWGIGLRTVFVFHITWFVNSAAHTWGYQSHDTGDNSTNLWWVALLSFGEGWHNNHHANQNAANHGRRWWELDLTYRTIQVLSWIGLAREIKKA